MWFVFNLFNTNYILSTQNPIHILIRMLGNNEIKWMCHTLFPALFLNMNFALLFSIYYRIVDSYR